MFNYLNIMSNEIINKIFNDEELNNFDKNLYLIQNDVKKNIYLDYFYLNEPELISKKLCDSLLEELNSYECKKINIEKLVPILEKVLENEFAIKYMYNNYCYHDKYSGKNYNYFEILYDKIIIKKEKNYVNLTEINDFAFSWLFNLYH